MIAKLRETGHEKALGSLAESELWERKGTNVYDVAQSLEARETSERLNCWMVL
jgi:hypothetical protein